jgi:hypothetical protein
MPAIYYCDTTGNDTTGNGTAGTPYLTINKCIAVATAGDEIRVGKTAAYTQYTAANCTWTNNTNTVATSASLVGSVAVGDNVGRPGAAGNGAVETFYKVTGITATTITLQTKYYGTTGTDTASIFKVVPTSAMSASAAVSVTVSKGVHISGGWNLSGTPAQDGETWITPTTVDGFNAISITASGSTISRMNVVDGVRCWTISTNTSGTLEYFTALSPSIYGVETVATSTVTISNVMSNGGVTNAAIALSAAVNNVTNVVALNGTGIGVFLLAPSVEAIGFAVYCSGVGYTTNSTSIKYTNCTAEYCSTAGFNISSNGAANNCTANYNTIGITSSTGVTGINITNCTLTGNTTYGIQATQVHGMEISGCTFTSNTIDVYVDQYSSNVSSYNNNHNTPVNYAYSKPLNAGTINIYNCSIDAPSAGKAFNIVAGASYLIPHYSIQNSFGGIYGSFYANGQVIRDTTTLSTTGEPTLNVQYSSTVSVSRAYLKIASFYANSATAHTISYGLRAAGAWTGTLIPVIKLNGIIIKTGTSITSISNGSWDSKTLSVTTGEVTADGELSLEFNINSNNIAINVGDIEVS